MKSNTTLKCKIFPQSIPNDWRRDPSRNAELRFYDKLRDQLPSEWCVFYDVAWLSRVRNERPEDGQIDFLILNPEYGLLLIELKGGGISFSASTGMWISTARFGINNEIKDPFRQVERSKYALKNKVQSVPSLARSNLVMYAAVAFPDVEIGNSNLSIDAPAQIIIDQSDLANLEQKILAIFKFLSGGEKQAFGKDETKILVSLLAPTLELKNLLASQFEEENAEIIRLTANQFKILEGFRRTPRIAIGGCAGSGKTLLALQKATQLAAEGFATLLLCYNRKLANHLESLVKGQPLLEVKTFHQFCVDAAKFSNQTLPAIAKLTQQQLEIEYALILCEAMSSRPEKRYDAIIVDEAQDFHKDWWDALETSLKSGSQSILYAFYDDNQKIYRRMGGLPSTMPSYDLYDNIRNSQPIFRCAETFYACDNDRRIEPRGPAVRPVEWLRYQNRSDLQQCLSNIIKRLTKDERVATTDIVILTPRSLDERSCLLQLKLAGDLKIVKHGAPVQGDEIAASTINSFKGLESNVVIVTELDEDFQNRPLNELTNLLYVATSRAKNLLVVLSHYKFNEEIYHAN